MLPAGEQFLAFGSIFGGVVKQLPQRAFFRLFALELFHGVGFVVLGGLHDLPRPQKVLSRDKDDIAGLVVDHLFVGDLVGRIGVHLVALEERSFIIRVVRLGTGALLVVLVIRFQ